MKEWKAEDYVKGEHDCRSYVLYMLGINTKKPLKEYFEYHHWETRPAYKCKMGDVIISADGSHCGICLDERRTVAHYNKEGLHYDNVAVAFVGGTAYFKD